MENMILGLLLLCGRTIYELRERIDKGLNLMYSSSMGSIQAAVKKLLRCGYITYEEAVENGKYKKIYRITESGKQHFLAWVNTPIEEQGSPMPGACKGLFSGLCGQGKTGSRRRGVFVIFKKAVFRSGNALRGGGKRHRFKGKGRYFALSACIGFVRKGSL